MTSPPFLTYPVRGKRDVVLVRHQARRIAHLLRYEVRDQACIAAGAFAIAHQMLARMSRFVVCFQIAQNHLHVFARPAEPAADAGADATAILAQDLQDTVEAGPLLHLNRPLPAEQAVDASELGWLVGCIDHAVHEDWFDEVVKQNQEILALIHELQFCQAHLKKMEGQPKNPSAA